MVNVLREIKSVETTELRNISKSVTNTEQINRLAIPLKEMQQAKLPQFNIPAITQAIRFAPIRANLELMQKHTQEIIHQINIPQLIEKSQKPQATGADKDLQKAIQGLTKKMETIDKLDKTLTRGIRSQIVYQDLIDTQDTMSKITKDTSV